MAIPYRKAAPIGFTYAHQENQLAKRTNKPLAIKRFMENHPLALGFVLEAIYQYSRAQLKADDWKGDSLISQDLWRDLARKALDVVNAD